MIFNVSTIPTTVAEKTFSGPMFEVNDLLTGIELRARQLALPGVPLVSFFRNQRKLTRSNYRRTEPIMQKALLLS
jgi:hypothetical protein